MFDFLNRNKTKTQIMELNYSRESDILQEINRIAFKTKDLTEANKIIADILSKYYNIEYCSLFLYSSGKMNISYTNIDKSCRNEIEKFVNEMYHERFFDEKEDIDAYIIKSENGLQYPTAEERRIVHMMFIPLILDQVLGGIMIENTSNDMDELEYEFFQVVIDNISIIIQNLLYFKQIIDNSNIDGLTNIYNRYYLNSHLSRQIEIFSEKTGIFSITMVDIDHFKIFNDNYGHLHGDKVLRAVAQYIKDNIREIDTVYRYGGEEFIIDMPNLQASDAFNKIESIREGISNMEVYTDDGHLTRVTASFGIAEFPTVSDSMNGLIECADKSLYVAKESGRNQTVIYKI
ncbi:MAG TPA: hypothetical protein DEP72_01640 [Clostridiales bacterium]|nr:MAG: hypothetical protein A2Y18_07555 [Clostridiales bacterium GWD2_32_19]HCC06856.1 hypothetical protein [Clostridiales bacterium]